MSRSARSRTSWTSTPPACKRITPPRDALRERCRRILADVLELGLRQEEFAIEDVLLTVTAIGGLGVQVAQWFGPGLDRTREQVAQQYVQFALRMVDAGS
ncbi:hypothetical protein [Streptomyces echinatus]|uniref:hypothetical protein n=1 Tax=Streptomyces echinatus TaxID=67293 RepID=UPI0016083A5A